MSTWAPSHTSIPMHDDFVEDTLDGRNTSSPQQSRSSTPGLGQKRFRVAATVSRALYTEPAIARSQSRVRQKIGCASPNSNEQTTTTDAVTSEELRAGSVRI